MRQICLLLLAVFCGCGTPSAGEVQFKGFEPAYEYGYPCECLLSQQIGGVDVCTVHRYCTGTQEAKYWLELESLSESGERVRFRDRVSQAEWDRATVGSWAKRADGAWSFQYLQQDQRSQK